MCPTSSSTPSRRSSATCWCSPSRRWGGGSRRGAEGLRLLRIGTEIDDRTDWAPGGRIADPASMEDQIPGRLDPIPLREDRPEVLLDLVRVALPAEAQPHGDPGDVSVDGDRGDAERV